MALKTNSNSFEYKDSQWGEPSIGRIPLIISQFYHGKMFSLLWEKPNFCFCFLAFSQEKGVLSHHYFFSSSLNSRQEATKMSSPSPTSEDRASGLNLNKPLVELSRDPPSTMISKTSTLGSSIPLSKDPEPHPAFSSLLEYFTQNVGEIIEKKLNDSMAARTSGAPQNGDFEVGVDCLRGPRYKNAAG